VLFRSPRAVPVTLDQDLAADARRRLLKEVRATV